MQNVFIQLVALLGCLFVFAASASTVTESIDASGEKYTELAMSIWDLAELGYLETESSGLLQSTLADAGFQLELGIAEIALQCGYSEQSSLTRQFKSAVGCPPGEFRRRLED